MMSGESDVVLERVSKVYESGGEDLAVLESFSHRFKAGEVAVILGPSGCGKTTLLRLIAGLEELTSGTIRLPKSRRQVGMVFQEYTAFPWLTVARNVEFGLRHSDTPREEFGKVVDYWLRRVGLSEFRNVYPAQLSGGMRQRLALARCLAPQPSVVLLDEPFGSLDAITRLQIGSFTKDLLTDLKVTVIMSTHSVREAVRLADHLMILSPPPARIMQEFIHSQLANTEHPEAAIEQALNSGVDLGRA